jgi:Flp pilus assembly protein TadG
MLHRGKHQRTGRRGVAAVEAAVLLPILTLVVLGVCELSWFVYSAQVLHSAARQGARAAVWHHNTNAQVEAEVRRSVGNSMGLDPAAVSVRLSKLNAAGQEEYQVQNLSENEQGDPIRVMVSVNYGSMGFATNMLGLKDGQLSSYAVMQRRK